VSLFAEALVLAARAHDGQKRKGTTIPYIVHPVAVAGLVAQFGGDEDLQIAALLHDVLEDGGIHYESAIAAFGDRVLTIVRGCTDGVKDAQGRKADWQERKRTHICHLTDANDDVLLVSGCDKLHNARSILEDLCNVGPDVFDRFKAGQEGTLWYYRELGVLFQARRVPMAAALGDTLQEIAARLAA
jgi:GTP pyrophosphokinase